MVAVKCAQCSQSADLSLGRNAINTSSRTLELSGTITCQGDGHQWPIRIQTDSILVGTEQMLPVVASGDLSPNVPDGLRQDILEAEKAHFCQVYKASVVMCRRAIQLALSALPHDVADGPFSRMLSEAQAKSPPVLSARGAILAEGVKDYGDGGAHRAEDITADHVRAAIFSAVNVLNELFPS